MQYRSFFMRACLTGALSLVVALSSIVLPTPRTFALSDIQILPVSPEAIDEAEDPRSSPEGLDVFPSDDPLTVIPSPDPLINRPARDGIVGTDPQAPAPEVLYDLEKAPEPVRRMRELILEAAATGDMSKLAPLLNAGPNETRIQPSDGEISPVDSLRALSGDDDGIEVLAILMDILSTGFVHVDAGTPDEAYVWPYFVEKPLATLSPRETVELLRIVTAGDVAAMQEYGNYNFFRTGITPDGQWKFITAGD